MKKLAVVIPTYNRKEKLFHVLFVLNQQSLEKKFFEIVVVDDGSTDGTEKEIKKWKKEFGLEFKYFRQKNKKQGAARNLGIRKTKADYILFLGDDIIPLGNDFLEKYFEKIKKSDGKTAFLGFTTWHPKIIPNRFLYWLEHGGPQFDYHGLENNKKTDFWHFYTSNIALPRKALEKENFDTKFQGYGYEDIELGYRLFKNYGLRLVFLSEAKAGHDHEMEMKDIWKRIPEMKKAAIYFEERHPEVAVLPKGKKKKILWVITRKPCVFLAKILHKEWGWYLEFKRRFLFEK